MENWLAAVAAGVVAVFGGFAGKDASSTMRQNVENRGSTTQKEMKDMNRKASTTKPTIDMACVAAVTATREASLQTGEATFTQGVSAAYSTRATALAAAYAQSDATTIKDAVRAAWKQFSDSTKGAKSAWQKSKESAWNTYRTAIKSCGTNAASIADTVNAGSEMSGQ